MVWGEKDKRKGAKHLEGHGVAHIIQGHLNELRMVLPKLNDTIQRNKIAKADKFGNYTIRINNYRFVFMLVDKEDGTPDHAVLVTAFKR